MILKIKNNFIVINNYSNFFIEASVNIGIVLYLCDSNYSSKDFILFNKLDIKAKEFIEKEIAQSLSHKTYLDDDSGSIKIIPPSNFIDLDQIIQRYKEKIEDEKTRSNKTT